MRLSVGTKLQPGDCCMHRARPVSSYVFPEGKVGQELEGCVCSMHIGQGILLTDSSAVK